MSMYENVGMTSLDYMEEILRLRKALADVADECSKAYDKIAQLENPWISVEDRMPEKDGSYLIAMYHRLMVGGIYKTYTARFVASFNAEYKEWTVMGEVCTTVTHWMNLPDFPEE